LVEILKEFLKFRKEVVLRRVEYDLEKAKERAHVLEGIEKCLEKVKEVISLIKKSKDRKEAQIKLIKNFGLDEIQANAILEMKLANLAKLERKKIEDELKEKRKKIKEFSEILKSPKKIKEIIKKELEEVKEKFGDERKTKVFERKIEKISEEELIPEEKTLIFLTKGGYIKRVKPKAYKVQKRGGKGLIGIETKEEDIVEHFLLANTRDRILFFTDSGKVYSLPAHEIPEADRLARGRGIMNFLQISPREKISAILNLEKKDFLSDKNYLAMATKDGLIKKSPLKVFKKIRKNGLLAIKLKKGDYLKSVKKTEGKDEIILLTKKGMAIRFNEKEIRPMGRASTGVKGIKLKKDELAGMDVIKKGKEKNHLLTLTENGYGKQTDLKEYKLQKRGGMGIKAAKINLKTGKIVSFKVLTEEEDLIIISERGQALRTKISLIPKLKRFAQGVKVMKLEKDDKIASAIAI
jgi:DNA gyrase subunit A